MAKKRALITGITGQDGSYLAELLVGKKYAVEGIDRGDGDLLDHSFIRGLVEKRYDEIYNLASISTVASPWEDPVGVVKSTALIPLLFLEAIRASSSETKFFQASSAEMYGDPAESPQTETTHFNPRSPYGWGKLLAHQAVEGYRSAHNVCAVSGILFNHESPRRGEQFVTRKITSTLAHISRGAGEVLQLGNLDAKRDWSFAGDIVRGMWMSLQSAKPDSYVFASGEVHTVREFVEEAARALGTELHWEGKGIDEKGLDAQGKIIVEISSDFYRPLEKQIRCGDITRASTKLGWKPETSFKKLIEMMVQFDSKR